MTCVVKFAKPFSKLREPVFSTIRLNDPGASIGDRVVIQLHDGAQHPGRLLYKHQATVASLPTVFLTGDTDTSTRDEALAALRAFYPSLQPDALVTILRVAYEQYPRAFLAGNLRVDCYMAVLQHFRDANPDAWFEVITRKGAESPLSPSWGLLNAAKAGKMGWEEYGRRLKAEIHARPEAMQRMRVLRDLARQRPVFLVCFEKDPTACHRSLVRQWILEGEWQ